MTTWHYELGAIRWRRHDGKYDVRCHEPPRGWEAYAERLEYHPITGQPLKNPGWWIKETYTGEVE